MTDAAPPAAREDAPDAARGAARGTTRARGDATGAGPVVLFVRYGRFSHVNDSLLAALRRQGGNLTFDELDLSAVLRPATLAFQLCLLGTLAEYGPGAALGGRDRLRHCLMRSPAWYHATRRIIAARLARGSYRFTLQTQSLFNAALPGVPNLVYTDHAARARPEDGTGSALPPPSPRWLRQERAIFADAAHVFTFGSRVRQVLIDAYDLPPHRVTRAGTGPNIRPATPPDLSPARFGRGNILFAGIDWDRKGGPDLLAAFDLLRRRLPGVTLTIVGCHPPEAAGKPGCTVLGRVPLPVLAELYHAASCLCVPSRQEPFGNVFVEAGHFGLPVVATQVGDIGDVVRDGVNGWRVPPQDPQALADALWSVLRDADGAARMGRAGMAVTRDQDWDRVAARILAMAPGARG